ncbi:hypothetical protein PRZ48_009266 [Zasmidium cellare]|uniref:Uncharacterized protein n=1 Tax=Zasmidium cellare TaxID=395010 RepID=A0ABR0EBW4_ZASCE|nr:hypothetical protein PRZ48_009266 [Zasmidium cellare]
MKPPGWQIERLLVTSFHTAKAKTSVSLMDPRGGRTLPSDTPWSLIARALTLVQLPSNRINAVTMDHQEPLTLENALTLKAWKDPAFREELERDANSALQSLNVTVPEGVTVVMRIQRPDTLYYMIPPLAARDDDLKEPINQTDLWKSGDLFLCNLPEALKVTLLQMRQAFRKAQA